MTSAKHTGKKPKGEATALRDTLPFFTARHGKVAASWWNVTPSGDYVADLRTGAKYARAFMPMLHFNAGASDLALVVSHMAKAGRDPMKNPEDWRGIDAVALGFLMEIGTSLQAAMVSIALAAVAIERPASDLGPKFVELVKAGGAMQMTCRATLYHDPNANIWEGVHNEH